MSTTKPGKMLKLNEHYLHLKSTIICRYLVGSSELGELRRREGERVLNGNKEERNEPKEGVGNYFFQGIAEKGSIFRLFEFPIKLVYMVS